MVIGSDDEVWSDVDAEENVCSRPARDEGEIDPMSNIPDAPSHIGLDGKINLKLWQVFDDHKHFGGVLLDFCIQEGFEIKKKKLDRVKVMAVCKTESCPWCIHASMSADETFFIIKTLNEEHSCQQVQKN